MGRGARQKETASHWTDHHPDSRHWTPHQRALAGMMTEEAYNGLYGRGGAEKKQAPVAPLSPEELLKRIRSEGVEPDREVVEEAVFQMIREEREEWQESFPGQGPLGPVGDNRGASRPSRLLARSITDDFLRRAQDKEIPDQAVTALGALLEREDNMELLRQALIYSSKNTFIENDEYLFQKLLPALVHSSEWEEFTVRDSNLRLLIKSVIQSKSVGERWGNPEEHHEALTEEINQLNPALGSRFEEMTALWESDWSEHIGQAGGDTGYVNFIQLGDHSEKDPEGFVVSEAKENALQASREGLRHLVATQVGIAALLSGEGDSQKKRIQSFLREGGTAEDLLEWKESDTGPMEMLVASGWMGSAASDLEDLWEERCAHHKSSPGDYKAIMAGLFADAVEAASEKYIESFGSPPRAEMRDLLFLELQKKLQL